MSYDDLTNKDVEKFRKEISKLINEISFKLLELISESGEKIPAETLTMALVELSSAIAVQTGCPKETYLLLAELAHKRATKQEMSNLLDEIKTLNKTNKKDLN